MVNSRYRLPPQDVDRHIADIGNRVGKLERSPRIVSASIDKGSLVVKNGNSIIVEDDGGIVVQTAAGSEVAFIGRLRGSFTSNDAANWIRFSRADGSKLLEVFSDDQVDTGTSFQFFDAPTGTTSIDGQPIFSDNTTYGGMRHPYLPVCWRDATTAFVTTTSSTFGLVAQAGFYMYHYMTAVEVDLVCPAGTTGEVQLRMDFTSVGGTDNHTLDVLSFDSTTTSPVQLRGGTSRSQQLGAWGPGNLSSNETMSGWVVTSTPDTGSFVRMAVEVRRTGGTGTIQALVRDWYCTSP